MASITLKRRSALTGLSMPAKAQAIAVSDAGAATRFVYRGPSSAVETAFALSLPTTPCRAKARDDRAALWLGPDEWLLIISSDAVDSLVASIKSALIGKPASLVDVSHRNAGLVIEGDMAADVLSAGCPLDLDLAEFQVGMCTRTLFGKAEVVIWRTATSSFRLEVWRSFAAYVIGLLDAAIGDSC